MRALLVGLLLVAAVALAAAPAAEARQFCTYGDSDPCDEYALCVWNHLEGAWDCHVRMGPCTNVCGVP